MDSGSQNGDFDLADFAQEFMRRGSVYRRQYATISQAMRDGREADCNKEMARSWGLVFPGSTRCRRAQHARNLVCR